MIIDTIEHMNELKFSLSNLKAGDNDEWRDFLAHILPRLDALLKSRLSGKPKHSFGHIDTIKLEVTALLWSKISSCQLDQRKDIVRYALNIAYTKAMQVAEKRYDFMGNAKRAGIGVDHFNSKMPSEFLAVRDQDPQSREEGKRLRKAINAMLFSYTNNLDIQLNEVRESSTSSPLLMHSVLDAACNGKNKRGLLSAHINSLEPYELTRLKNNALAIMAQHLKPQIPTDSEFTELNWELFEPGGVIAEIWHDSTHGCFRYMRGLDAMHESHEIDLSVYKNMHLNLCECEICCITKDEHDQERLESWSGSLQESIMRSH